MRADPVELARELVAIDSVNPSLVGDAAGESDAADFCERWLAAHGFEVRRLESVAGRPSVVGIARGSGGGRSIMLNGHLDTVGVITYRGEPFTPVIRDGRLYGRGAFDMKGGIAAMLAAAAAAAATPLRGDVVVTLVADEEFGSRGTEEVLARYTADAAIVTEPSGLELTVAHRGFAWFRIDIEGLAAHGSQPELGVDAIAHAGKVLAALDALRATMDVRPRHPLLGQGSVRVSTIRGGVDAATVAPSATLTIERRFLPGESPEAVEQELRSALDGLLDSETPGVARATLTRLVARGAFEASDGDLLAIASAHAERVLGHPAVRRGEPFWTDAGLIAEAGIPCLVIGVDGGGAHADIEWATIESIERLSELLEGVIVEFCG